MLEESLKEELNIPPIGGILIAEFGLGPAWDRATQEANDNWSEKWRLYKQYSDKFLAENYEFRWKVFFWYDGPDRRYKGAGINISEATLPELIQDFETALSLIQQLSSSNFSGTYEKRIGTFTNPRLEVTGKNGALGLQFSISNDTRRLYKTISHSNLPYAINQLKYAITRGPQLIETLRSIIAQRGTSE